MADNDILVDGKAVRTDDIGSVYWPVTKVAYGADGSATEVDASNPMPVLPAGGAVTPSDALSNPTTHGAVVGYGLAWDGTQWVRVQQAPIGYDPSDVIAQASRTATVSSPYLQSRGARGVMLTITLYTVPGSGGDLTLTLRTVGGGASSTTPQGIISREIPRASVFGGGTSYSMAVYPGVSDPGDGTGDLESHLQMVAKSFPLTPFFRVTVTHSDSQTWEYSVSAVLLP